MSDTLENWLPEARVIAAQCWCEDTTKHIDMDPALAEVVAYKIAAWMDTGAFHARNEAYWRERAQHRQWVDLTDEEINACWLSLPAGQAGNALAFYHAVSAALKDKNT